MQEENDEAKASGARLLAEGPAARQIVAALWRWLNTCRQAWRDEPRRSALEELLETVAAGLEIDLYLCKEQSIAISQRVHLQNALRIPTCSTRFSEM